MHRRVHGVQRMLQVLGVHMHEVHGAFGVHVEKPVHGLQSLAVVRSKHYQANIAVAHGRFA
jgi:hypothetical protein